MLFSDWTSKRLRLVPLLLGLVVAAPIFVAGGWLRDLQQSRARGLAAATLRERANHVKDMLSSELSTAFVEVAALADWTAIQEEVTDEEFEEFSRRMIMRHQALLSTTDLPNDVILRAYPPNAGLVGLNVAEHPTQGDAVAVMRERGSPVVTGPIELKQGGLGLIVRAPVYRGGSYQQQGHVSLVFDLGLLKTQVEDFAERNQVYVRVEDADQRGLTSKLRFAFGHSADDESLSEAETGSVVELPLEVGQETWSIRVGWAEPLAASAWQRHGWSQVILWGTWIAALVCGFGAFWMANVALALRDANRRLQASNVRALAARDAKAAFLANMSHELRTPMNGVIATSQMLEATQLSPAQRELVSTIRESSKSLLLVINDILDFSKLESDKVVLCPEPTTIRPLLDSVARLFLPLAQEKQLSFTVNYGPELPEFVTLDPLRLRQILSNLLSNAVKFTQQGSIVVNVSLAQRAGDAQRAGHAQLLVEVRDTGIGVRRPELLFADFVQGDASMTRHFGGTGLGLAITKKLVDRMGGEIGLESRPGEGSRFWFQLPVTDAASVEPSFSASRLAGVEPAAESSASAPPSSGRALVVDDNQVNRRVADRVLQNFGWQVQCVDNAEHALQAIEQEAFDIVLMDCAMPEIDGFEATRRIRALAAPYNSIPIIAMTANALQEDRERCRAAGMSDFLAKPLEVTQVRDALLRWGPDKMRGSP